MSGGDFSRDWMINAQCRFDDPDLYDSDNRGGGGARPAQDLCRECPVMKECAKYFLAHEGSCGVVIAGIPVPDSSSARHYKIAIERLERFVDTGILDWRDEAEDAIGPDDFEDVIDLLDVDLYDE